MDFSIEKWVLALRSEYRKVVFDLKTANPRKRALSESLLVNVFRQLNQTFEYLDKQKQLEVIGYTELALHTASLLYTLGKPSAVWKTWLALSSFGYLLQRDYHSARLYGVLSDEWDYLATVPKTPSGIRQTDTQCFEKLLDLDVEIDHKLPAPDMRELYQVYGDYNYDDYCVLLTESIPARDHAQTEECLIHIYEGWAQIDWDQSTPETYPEFEPVPCALAALAYQMGYRPQHLPEEVRRFYGPGLSVAESRNLFQKYFGG